MRYCSFRHSQSTNLVPLHTCTLYLPSFPVSIPHVQVRDLLLNKIQFSGEMAEDLEEGPAKEATPTNKDEDGMSR